MDDDTKNDINIEGDVSAWLANIGGTITVYGNLTLNQWREQQPDERRAQTDAPVFISYARANTDFARDLYIKLRALGFRLWRDRSDMAAGENWWGQIQTAISGSTTMVLCMSPEALASPVVADEWRYARRVGTRVIPVVAAEVDFENVPRWMSKLDWLDFRDGAAEGDIIWAKFINQLNTPPEGRPIPFSVPSLPVHFVERPDVFEPLLAQLLDADRQNPLAITTALQGGGGFGKTTLAQALCHDGRVRDAFDDGVLWVEFGESPDVLRLLNTQIQTLGGQGVEIDSTTAATRLRDLLEDRDVLLVLDDVWNAAHLRPFLQRTDKTRIAVLITTRLVDVVNASGAEQPVEVDEMTSQQAVDLLSAGLADAAAEQASLERLAARLGEWALMLELANGVLRKQTGRYGLAGAIQRLNEDLDEEGFVTFDPRSAEARNQSISKSLNVSLNLLDKEAQQRFSAVAIFPEDAEVPVTTLAALWEVGERQALRLCETLVDYSLVRFNGQARAIRLHDVVRGILAGRLDDPPALHRRLIDNYGDLTVLPDAYAWRNIAYHLIEADRLDTLRELLLDYDFLQAKLNATDTNALIRDCEVLPGDPAIRLMKSALSISAHILSHSPEQLSLQLYARLLSYTDEHSQISSLLTSCQHQAHPNLFPQTPTFQPVGAALIRTLVGHIDDVVWSVALAGEYAVSASNDHTLKVWNWHTGKLVRTLVGHTESVTHVALAGEYAVSASFDHTLKVWNWHTGKLVRTLVGHTNAVWSVALADEYAVSASWDKTLMVWNWHTGELLRTLKGHTNAVWSVALAGEYAVSATVDETLVVWNWHTGALVRTLRGHIGGVNNVALAGEYAVSASSDRTLKVWNWHTGELLHTLKGHTRAVWSVALAGHYAVSASWDKTLKVWNWHTGKLVRTLKGHTDDVNHVALTGDYAVSASSDHTLKVWKLPCPVEAAPRHSTSGRENEGELLRTLKGHTRAVWSVALAGHYAVSASWDKTLKVWNWHTGKLVRTLAGHKGPVNHVALTGDYVVSASSDHTLKVWKLPSPVEAAPGHSTSGRENEGELVRTLVGHTAIVGRVALAGDYAVSASDDHTLMVWNWHTGELLRTLTTQHSSFVMSVALAGEYAVSTSWDKSLKVWNWHTGELVRTLAGHIDGVWSVALAGEYAVSVSEDETLKLWNWLTGDLIATFYADAPLHCVAIAEDFERIVTGDKLGNVHFLRPNAALQRLLGVGRDGG